MGRKPCGVCTATTVQLELQDIVPNLRLVFVITNMIVDKRFDLQGHLCFVISLSWVG